MVEVLLEVEVEVVVVEVELEVVVVEVKALERCWYPGDFLKLPSSIKVTFWASQASPFWRLKRLVFLTTPLKSSMSKARSLFAINYQ